MLGTMSSAKKRKPTHVQQVLQVVDEAGSEAEAENASEVSEASEEGKAAVGRLVDCSQADDRRMIALVRERRLLYARNNMPVASYYSQVKKLWQEVADAMGWTVAEVRRKWSHIRNSYSRHLRNEMYGVCTSRGRIVSKWYLADELDFLRDHMATDTRPSRYSYTPLYLKVKGGAEEAAAEAAPELQPFLSAPPWLGLGGAAQDPPAEPRCEASSTSSVEHEEDSAYFQFFRSIHPDYRELDAKRQRKFRRECLTLMHRLLDGAGEAGGAGGEHPAARAVNLSAGEPEHDDERPLDVRAVFVKQEIIDDDGYSIE